MATTFCFALGFDMNIIANTHVSTVIFADVNRNRSHRQLIENDFRRFQDECPYLSVSDLCISTMDTKRMFPHFDPQSIQKGVTVSLTMFRVPKVCWLLTGDPAKIYTELYPRFFSVPKLVVWNDIPELTDQSESPNSLLEDFIEQANNNSNWVKPRRIRHRSAFIV